MNINELYNLIEILESKNIEIIKSIRHIKEGILITYEKFQITQYLLLPSNLNCPNKYDPNQYLCSICEYYDQCDKE